MKNRLVLYNFIVTAVALILFFGLGLWVTRENNLYLAENTVKKYTEIYANNYNTSENFTKEIEEDIRVTVVDSLGKVIADSKQIDVSQIENHLNREEVQAALNNKPKIVRRYSETLGAETMYYALKAQTGDTFVVVRVASEVANVNAFVFASIPILLFIISVALIVSIFLSAALSKKLVAPFSMVKNSLQTINEGEFVKVVPSSSFDEINGILSEINDISSKVESSLTNLKEESSKLDFVINNINDGVFAMDNLRNLILINNAAKTIFNVKDSILGYHISYLCFDEKLISNIDKCLKNKVDTVFELELENKIYLVTIKNLNKQWKSDAVADVTVVVLSEITASKRAEKLRSDFFANASHELKTPLTSIKGFNELMQIGNTDETKQKYLDQIATESNRMLTLIEDMLKLSSLETAVDVDKSTVDLYKTSCDVLESLTTVAKEKGVMVSISGSGFVEANSAHIYELIKNLSENAIRYNFDGGNVEILISSFDDDTTVLQVKDNGIGIEEKHQSRIFERFYRVEKSRSRATGGTGLGLSIVKHICGLYNAKISLMSKIGVGTTIAIEFKNQPS